jgi:hypothetical protein
LFPAFPLLLSSRSRPSFSFVLAPFLFFYPFPAFSWLFDYSLSLISFPLLFPFLFFSAPSRLSNLYFRADYPKDKNALIKIDSSTTWATAKAAAAKALEIDLKGLRSVSIVVV